MWISVAELFETDFQADFVARFYRMRGYDAKIYPTKKGKYGIKYREVA